MKFKNSPQQQQQHQHVIADINTSTAGNTGPVPPLHEMEAEVRSITLIIGMIQSNIHTLNQHINQYGTNHEVNSYLNSQEKQLEEIMWREAQLRVKLEMNSGTNTSTSANNGMKGLISQTQSPTAQSGFGLLEQGEIEHRFSDKSYINGTCSLCDKKITERKAAKCDFCSYVCHTKCVSMAKPTCIQTSNTSNNSSQVYQPKTRLTGRTRSAGARDAFVGLGTPTTTTNNNNSSMIDRHNSSVMNTHSPHNSGVSTTPHVSHTPQPPHFPIHLGRQNSDRPRVQRAATLDHGYSINNNNTSNAGHVGGNRDYNHISPGTSSHVQAYGSVNDMSSVGVHHTDGVYSTGSNSNNPNTATAGSQSILRALTGGGGSTVSMGLQTRKAGEMSLPTSPTQLHDKTKHTVKGVFRSISRTGRTRSSSLDRRSDKPNASVFSEGGSKHGNSLTVTGSAGTTSASVGAHPTYSMSHAGTSGSVGYGGTTGGVVQSASTSPKMGMESIVPQNRHSRANSIIKGLQKSLRRSYSQRNLSDANLNSYIYHQQGQLPHGAVGGVMRESTSTGSTTSHGSYGPGTPPREKFFGTSSRHNQSKSSKDLYEGGVKDAYKLDRSLDSGPGLGGAFAGVNLALVTEAKERPLRPLNMPSYDDSYRGLRSDSIGEEVEDFTMDVTANMGASMEFQERYQSLRSEHSSPVGIHLDDLISHEAFPIMRGDSQLNNSSLLSAVAEDRVLATESSDNYNDAVSPDGYVRGFSSAVKALTSDGDVNGVMSMPPPSSGNTEMKKISSWKAEVIAAEAADTATHSASVEDYGEVYTSGSEATASESSYTTDDYSDHETDSLADFEVPIESLEFGKCIGEGTFGTVYKGNWHGKVAIKVLKVDNPTEEQLSTFRNEAAVLMACRHDNILLFMGACTLPPKLCLITEWCEGDTLYKRLYDDDQQPLTVVDVCSVAYECAVGLSYLHAKQIVHRDLKSANIFLVSQRNKGIATYSVRIGDFGLAAAKSNVGQSGDKTSTPVGSILWMAPEMVRRKPDEDLDFYFSDVYSYGIVMYECLAAELPYQGLIPDQILVMVGMGLIAPAWDTVRKDICSEIVELSIECTNRDPTRRPSFRTISLRMGEFMDQAIKQGQSGPEVNHLGATASGISLSKTGSPNTPTSLRGQSQRTSLTHADAAMQNIGTEKGFIGTTMSHIGLGSVSIPESPRVAVTAATPDDAKSGQNYSLSPRPMINRSQSNRTSTTSNLQTGVDAKSVTNRTRSGSDNCGRPKNSAGGFTIEFARRSSGRASSPLKRVDSMNKLNDSIEPGNPLSSGSKDGLLLIKKSSVPGHSGYSNHGNRKDDDSDSDMGGENGVGDTAGGLHGNRNRGVLHSSSLISNSSGNAMFTFAKRASSGGVTDRGKPNSTANTSGIPTSVFDFGRRLSGTTSATGSVSKGEDESGGDSSAQSDGSGASMGVNTSTVVRKSTSLNTPHSTFDFTRRDKGNDSTPLQEEPSPAVDASTFVHKITSTSTDAETTTGGNSSTDTLKNIATGAETKTFAYPTSAFDFSRRADKDDTVSSQKTDPTNTITHAGASAKQSKSVPLGKGLPQTAPINSGGGLRVKSAGTSMRLDLPPSDFDISIRDHGATAPVKSHSGTFAEHSTSVTSSSGVFTAGLGSPTHTATVGSAGSSRSSGGVMRQTSSVKYPTSTFDFSRKDKDTDSSTAAERSAKTAPATDYPTSTFDFSRKNKTPADNDTTNGAHQEPGDERKKNQDTGKKFAYPTSTFDFSRGKASLASTAEKPRESSAPIGSGATGGQFCIKGVAVPTSTFDFSRGKSKSDVTGMAKVAGEPPADHHSNLSYKHSAPSPILTRDISGVGIDAVNTATKSPKQARPTSAGISAPTSSFDFVRRNSGKRKGATNTEKRFSMGPGMVVMGSREPRSNSVVSEGIQLSPRTRPASSAGTANGVGPGNVTSKTVLRERSNSRTSFTSLRNSISGLGRHAHGHKDKESKKRKDNEKNGTANTSTGTVAGEESGLSTESLHFVPTQQDIKAALQMGTSRVTAPSFVPSQKDIQNALYKGSSRVRLLSAGTLTGSRDSNNVVNNTGTNTGTSCASEDVESDDYEYKADGNIGLEQGAEFREDVRTYSSGGRGEPNLNVRKSGSVGSVSVSSAHLSSNPELKMGRDRDRSHSLSRHMPHTSTVTVNRSNSTVAGGKNPYTDAPNQLSNRDEYKEEHSHSSGSMHSIHNNSSGSKSKSQVSGYTPAYHHVPSSYTIKTRAGSQSPLPIEKTLTSPSLMTSLGVGSVASVARQPSFDFTPQETSPRIMTPDIDEQHYDYEFNKHHTNFPRYGGQNNHSTNSNDSPSHHSINANYDQSLTSSRDSTGSYILSRKNSGNRGPGATLGASAGSGEKGAYGSATYDLSGRYGSARDLRVHPHPINRPRGGSVHETRTFDNCASNIGLNDTPSNERGGEGLLSDTHHKPLQASRSAEMPYVMTGMLWEDTGLAGNSKPSGDDEEEMFDYTKPDSARSQRRHSQSGEKGRPHRRHSNHGLTPGIHLQVANGEVTPVELAEKRGRVLGSTSVFMDVPTSSESSDEEYRGSGTDTGPGGGAGADTGVVAMATSVVSKVSGEKRAVSRKRGSVADAQNRMASVSEAERERSVSRSVTPVGELGAVEIKTRGLQVTRQVSGQYAPPNANSLGSLSARNQGQSYSFGHNSDAAYTGRSRSHTHDWVPGQKGPQSRQRTPQHQNIQQGVRSQMSSHTHTSSGSGVLRDGECSFDLGGFSAVQDSPVLTNLEAVTDADHSSTNLAGTYTHSPLIAANPASSAYKHLEASGNVSQSGSDNSTENPLFRGVSPEPSPTWYR